MARYGKTTRLPPKQVVLLAHEHFGPDSSLGLPITRESWNEVTFEGAGGGVTVTALPQAGDLGTTEVTILSREYDTWVERFLGALPGPARRPFWRRH